MRNVLLCETKLASPKEKIVSTLGSEKVLLPSSEELTFEPNSRAIALASRKRGVSWGSEKGLLPTAVIYVNGSLGKLKLRCVFDSVSESSFLTLHAAERLGLDKIKLILLFKLRVLVAALWDKKLAFRTRERRKILDFTDGPQRREKKEIFGRAVLRFNSASEKESVLLIEDQTDL
ncbi:uncharacterized protein TNCV_3381991 [Trichonephila clavipes]|nr:uncharacterized protein TNCV_3381991 [Trichonephila clavipes]